MFYIFEQACFRNGIWFKTLSSFTVRHFKAVV